MERGSVMNLGQTSILQKYDYFLSGSFQRLATSIGASGFSQIGMRVAVQLVTLCGSWA